MNVENKLELVRKQTGHEFKDEAPELDIGSQLYFMAFLQLTTCRNSNGFGEGPISWYMIQMWAEKNGIEGEQAEDLHTIISAMDLHYLAFTSKKVQIKGQKNGKRP